MYSSGGDLHLELPSGATEGPQALWEIPPYTTKSVMKANFIARLENNHTAYIRIKTNTTGAEFLYLPLEVEVSSAAGLYCPQVRGNISYFPQIERFLPLSFNILIIPTFQFLQESIDFGLLPSNGPPATIKLLLLNSGNKPIPVQNVIATPVTEAMQIDFSPTKIPPDTVKPSVVAQVKFDRKLVQFYVKFRRRRLCVAPKAIHIDACFQFFLSSAFQPL